MIEQNNGSFPIKFVAWDLDGTLVRLGHMMSQDFRERIARPSALELLKEAPRLRLMEDGANLVAELAELGVTQGIATESAYQAGINAVAASNLREYIDPRFIGCTYALAWEECVYDNADYMACEKRNLKPSPAVLNRLSQRTGYAPSECLVIGDTQKDIDMAKNAGWNYMNITYAKEAVEFLRKARREVKK